MSQKNFGRLAATLFFIAAASFFIVAAIIGPLNQRTVWMIFGGVFAVLAAAILLFEALVGGIEKVEPTIINLDEPIKMIGVSTRTGMKTIFKDAASLGQEYKKLKDANLIRDKKEPWGFVAVSKDFQGEESWEYLMGDVVNSLDFVPEGCKSFEIPAMTYAVFPIRPKSKLSWGITIGLTKKYIFTEWLPNSKYESDNSILGDFEYHDQRSLAKRPEIDLYIAIKEKPQNGKFHAVSK
ncbi:MAG: AraC family transcriptional regulator [Chloroflexi bacterium]|nr:MAG: AraC family transcriptional regulator [Chloroflexota bacterium]